jgi:hypothetical protein
LVLGDRDATAPRHLIPQQYISRAHKLKSGGDRDIVDGYTKLIYRFFSMLSARAPQVELSVLASDPNVRIIVIDAGDDERAKCLLSFAPSQVLDISHEFDSVGFMSRRKEMVAAAGKLWEFYATEKGRAVPMPDYDRYRSLFTTLQ